MNAKGLFFYDIRTLSHPADPGKDSMNASLITRAWKEEKLTEQLISRESQVAREESIRVLKGLVYGGFFSVMLWSAIVSGFYILF